MGFGVRPHVWCLVVGCLGQTCRRQIQNAYLQKQEGAIHDAHWTGITRMMIDYTDMRSYPIYWRDRRHWSSDQFADYIDKEIIPKSAADGVSIPGDYI